jgi:hypothetical protein
LDKLLGATLRTLSGKRAWKCIGRTLYREAGPLFFVLVVATGARERVLHWSLRVKWTEMDAELWRVLGMHSNLDEPISLHANGAFTLTGHELAWSRIEECTWTPEGVRQLLEAVLTGAEGPAAEVAARIRSIEEFMDFAAEWHADLLVRAPGAVVNLWKERVLFHLLRGERETALQIAEERATAGDSGGFTVGGSTFFEKAKRYASIPV